MERQGAGRIVHELHISIRCDVDQTAGGVIELGSGQVQGRGRVTVALDETRSAERVGHAIVILELGVERSHWGCTDGKCRCSEGAEGKERKQEKPLHRSPPCKNLRSTPLADSTLAPLARQEAGGGCRSGVNLAAGRHAGENRAVHPSLEGRRFRGAEMSSEGEAGPATVFEYHENEGVVWARYEGRGHL